MNFGPQVNEGTGKEMLDVFVNNGYSEIDTAYIYNGGDTDGILGQVLPNYEGKKISIATKIHPRVTGKLDGSAVRLQFNESIARLGLDKIDILYFHFPDKITPIENALEEINLLYLENKIKEFGLSNFPAWMVVEIWHICKENGWILPTLYQGRYNGLSRNVESELIPTLRHLGMRFYAYNPLAGGMLTGKHIDFNSHPKEGRFSRLESYRKRYWKESYFEAVKLLLKTCKGHNIKPVDAAYRWLVHHSLLDVDVDGVIIGASSTDQLNQNMLAVNRGGLPQQVVDAFDVAWGEAKFDSPEYFKFI